MPAPSPLFASERTAARLLDMKPGEFRELVRAGHLPPAETIGHHERWRVSRLEKIASGDAIDGLGDVGW